MESVLIAFEKAGFGRGGVLKMLLGAECPKSPRYPALTSKYAAEHIGPHQSHQRVTRGLSPGRSLS